jgi:hypothetical protein
MPATALTKKQRRLLREVDQITDLLNLNHRTIKDYESSARTIKLESIVRWLARGAVVQEYTLIDELLADQICWFYFGRSTPFWKLWRTKKFRLFNHHILQEMYPLVKLRLIKECRQLPRKVASDIQELNTLRNGMAHAFFPENLKRAKPVWKGKNIFSIAGLSLFQADMKALQGFFFRDAAYRRQGRIVSVSKARKNGEPSAGQLNFQGGAPWA